MQARSTAESLHADPIRRPVRPSFADALEAVGEQVELDDLIVSEPEREGLYREMVRAVADAYMHDPDSPSRVDDGLSYGVLQEAYRDLTGEHLRYAAGRFLRYARPVYSPRLFFQTALYNAPGEMESRIERLIARGQV